jgi:hypothetical protein
MSLHFFPLARPRLLPIEPEIIQQINLKKNQLNIFVPELCDNRPPMAFFGALLTLTKADFLLLVSEDALNAWQDSITP